VSTSSITCLGRSFSIGTDIAIGRGAHLAHIICNYRHVYVGSIIGMCIGVFINSILGTDKDV
jgi:hypothetical protein